MEFAGNFTSPGFGVPPAISSGAVAAHWLHSEMNAEVSPLFVLNGVACVLLAWRLYMSTKMRRSLYANMRYFYLHGRSFFAGASLMKLQEFLDTAALYGLFRIADDCVDDVDDHASRRQRLADFEGKFWKAWKSQDQDCYHLHPVLPSVIEACSRLNFPEEFFECFFSRMRADTGVNICQNMEDCYWYMEGSAAVIGDFMLPIMMPDATEEERDLARPYAKDLGRAFQLTNFCRDIDEDIDIQRQYVPVDLCNKHGVDLLKRTEKQEGFRALIEEMFEECDKLYKAGDTGITLLPERVRPVVVVASRFYQGIQDEIRKRDYNVFDKRVGVPTKKKIQIAMNEISLGLTLKMLAAEWLLLTLFFLDEVTIPFVSLLAIYQVCEVVAWPGLTYYGFHCVCTLPALALAFLYARSQAETPEYFTMACKWMAFFAVLATVYTTAWDNYLVYAGIWSYPAHGHTLGVIGYVPIEEYAFFTIQTVIVGMLWTAFGRCTKVPHFRSATNSRHVGLIAFALWMIAGCRLLFIQQTLYMGLITVWSVPILAFQWAFGADALMAQKNSWQKPLLYSWVFLCIIDRWAIRNGCWNIDVASTLPRTDFLPIEEAYFFLVTSTMCIWGLQLFMTVSVMDCSPEVAFWRAVFWCRKTSEQTLGSWVPLPIVARRCLSDMAVDTATRLLGIMSASPVEVMSQKKDM
jgi:lycopene cyclase domain-containing protein